jgi:hypothetical protein
MGRVRSLTMLGFLQSVIQQRRAEGDQKLQQAANPAREMEDGWGEGFAHMMLSMSVADAGDLQRTHFHARITLHTPILGPLPGIQLQQLGRATVEEDPERAMRFMGAAIGHFDRTGTVLPPFLRRRFHAARQRAIQLLGDQAAAQAFEEGRRISMDEVLVLADTER